MSYGPHTTEVLDLVRFLQSGGLLSDPRPPNEPGLKLIHDLVETNQYREVPEDAPQDRDLWNWQDILDYAGECGSDLLTERFLRLKAIPGLIDRLNRLMDGEVLDCLKRELEGRCSEIEILRMWGDIGFMLEYRACFGRSVPFIERLVDLYKRGGYPCGWEGLYPEGRLVVYFPQGNETGT